MQHQAKLSMTADRPLLGTTVESVDIVDSVQMKCRLRFLSYSPSTYCRDFEPLWRRACNTNEFVQYICWKCITPWSSSGSSLWDELYREQWSVMRCQLVLEIFVLMSIADVAQFILFTRAGILLTCIQTSCEFTEDRFSLSISLVWMFQCDLISA